MVTASRRDNVISFVQSVCDEQFINRPALPMTWTDLGKWAEMQLCGKRCFRCAVGFVLHEVLVAVVPLPGSQELSHSSHILIPTISKQISARLPACLSSPPTPHRCPSQPTTCPQLCGQQPTSEPTAHDSRTPSSLRFARVNEVTWKYRLCCQRQSVCFLVNAENASIHAVCWVCHWWL